MVVEWVVVMIEVVVSPVTVVVKVVVEIILVVIVIMDKVDMGWIVVVSFQRLVTP